MKPLLLIAIMALCPLLVHSQARTAERIVSVPFSQLKPSQPDGSTRIVINGTAGTPCTVGSIQVLAVKLNGVWTCTDLTASGGSGGAPINATFITQTPNSTLTAEQALSILASGILKGNTGTGVVTIAVPGTDYLAPAGNGSQLTALNASVLASGTLPDARFPSTLPILSGANLIALNAGNLSSGIVPDARFPITLPALSGANLTSLNASNLSSGTLPDARFPATLPAANGSNLTSLNASNLASGTVAPARLGTGSGGAVKFLREDSTWQTIGGGGDALVANPLSQFAATTSAQLAGVVSDETGTNKLVFSDNAVLAAPNLGTPSAVVLTNATGTAASLTAGTATIANAGDSATAFFSAGTIEVARGGTGLGAPADDQLIVGNGTIFDFKTLPACSNAVNDKLLYNSSTNAFSCGSDQASGGGSGITSLNTLTGATQTFSKTDDTNITLTLTPSGTDHNFAVGWTGTLADARVADNITLTNITQITNRAIGDITGDLAASRVDDGGAAATQTLFSGAGSAAGFRAIADADIPDTITVDLATLATTAATANAGDSATSFFLTGTIEAARLPDLSGLNGAVTDAQVPNTITVDLAATVTTNANLTGPITSTGNATAIAAQTGTGSTFVMQAGPTFTGTVTIPTPFTLGAVSVLPTGTELNFVDGVTSSIQTQLDAKAALAGPTFTGTVTIPSGAALGTPTTLTLTNATGLPVSTGISGLGTGVATFLATPSSANFFTTVTGETGSGAVVGGTSPAFTTNFTLANGTAPSTTAVAETAFDTNAWASGRGAVQVFDGTANTYIVATLASDTPTNGQVPVWNTGGTITWETAAGGGDMLLGSSQTNTARKLFNPATLVIGNVATPPTPELGALYVDTDDGSLYFGIDGSTWGEFFIAGLTTINLSSDIIGDLPFANFVPATAASKLVGRGSASGAGDFQEITIGSGLTMTGTTLSAASGGGDALVANPLSQFAATTSAQLAGVLSDESGTAGGFVRATGATLVTPALGAATATSINGLTITSSTGTLTVTNGKTASFSNTLTFTGTDSSSVALGAGGTVGYTIASGTSALGTSAITSGACASVVTTTATGTATTDVVWWGFNGDPTGVTGYAPVTTGALTIFAYPSTNNVNFKVCNLTNASITPGAITLNWRILR